MKHHSSSCSHILFPASVIFVLAILLLQVQFIRSQEVEEEREFDYMERSEKGPQQWGKLKKEWAACNNGGMQSPIDLSSNSVKLIPKLAELNKTYTSSNSTILNRGHDIALKWAGYAGSIHINGTEFFLQQCHWHSPSEHSVNGRRYDLELHMLHGSQDGNNKIAVVGLLYEIGQPDPFLSKLEKYIMSMVDEEHEIKIGVIDPSEIKLDGKNYYRYMGSLTVPPCTEGVIWTINEKIMTVSSEQVKLLREAVHDYAEKNARPVQPLNRREIHLFEPNTSN
ncbi:Alpha carbonic anhydrase [Quillaja saponaria]|uniref:Carbonic anhydrase n=1 Tax=Quillaja saponaria TaxID=32244 RepID=A0AAD7Q8J3_QUISA|nr:Alpha carbonic anhydrase [Quillaja saponaria]